MCRSDVECFQAGSTRYWGSTCYDAHVSSYIQHILPRDVASGAGSIAMKEDTYTSSSSISIINRFVPDNSSSIIEYADETLGQTIEERRSRFATVDIDRPPTGCYKVCSS